MDPIQSWEVLKTVYKMTGSIRSKYQKRSFRFNLTTITTVRQLRKIKLFRLGVLIKDIDLLKIIQNDYY